MLATPGLDRLETHDVTNQSGPLSGVNAYLADLPLREAVRREAGDRLDARCAALGEEVGSEAMITLGEQANASPPVLASFDRFGRRLDEVRFHPAYDALMAKAMRHSIHDVAWRERGPGRHAAHAALAALFSQVEAGTMCPINMTYASVPALRRQPDIGGPVLAKLLGGSYDPVLRPIAEKSGVTVGMAMTEKQGGSDVRANATRATPLSAEDRSWKLVGHKWFCSAPMSDAFLTTACTERGISCFLVPRITAAGERNAIHVMRLKEKLGNRSNASSEIEYHGAEAMLLGEEGQGVAVILDMVHHTRLGTIAGTMGLMRAALAQAVHHTRRRRAFQKALLDQPAMRAVVADLALEYEAAVALTMRVARAFDDDGTEAAAGGEAAFARIGVAIGKYWLTKRCPAFVAECMECLGGGGYVEEGPMPRLFRESPLNAIWEGSGNVIALDILRSLVRAPATRDALASELASADGASRALDAETARLRDLIAAPARIREADMRHVAERLALALQAALLVRFAPDAIADAFVATRIDGKHGALYGTLPDGVELDTILERHQVF